MSMNYLQTKLRIDIFNSISGIFFNYIFIVRINIFLKKSFLFKFNNDKRSTWSMYGIGNICFTL